MTDHLILRDGAFAPAEIGEFDDSIHLEKAIDLAKNTRDLLVSALKFGFCSIAVNLAIGRLEDQSRRILCYVTDVE